MLLSRESCAGQHYYLCYVRYVAQVFLNKLSEHNKPARQQLKHCLFPAPYTAKELPAAPSERQQYFTAHMMDPPTADGDIEGADTHRETRTLLLASMTSLDSQVKRCAAELIYTLCDEQSGSNDV